ncbi:MAG: hypothetical protein JJE30_10840 [Desulfuromonadales bacterium]|nr:hypothetical protein [Desulfuromonadales bacterium]
MFLFIAPDIIWVEQGKKFWISNRVYKGFFMKKSEGRKAQLPVNGIFKISFISILSFFMFSTTGYGSSDIPVNVSPEPVAIRTAALFTGFGVGSGLTNQGIFTGVNSHVGAGTASTFFTASDNEDAVTKETLHDIESENGTAHACSDSCSL